MKRFATFLLLVALAIPLLGQMKRDARSVGLAGAYTTVADGIFAVGYNPALLAFQTEKPFMMQLIGLDIGLVSNYISFSNINNLSGDTLTTNDIDILLRNLESGGGLTFTPDIHFATPALNFSSGNMALTSNTIIMSDIALPTGLLELLLKGNAHTTELDLTLNYEILGVNELGFSFAVPYEHFAWGITLKYLQGLFYFGVDPDSSSSSLVTTDDYIYGSGRYYMRQGLGGSGLGLDLGFATRRTNGWQFGVSFINAVGSIKWNNPSWVKDFLAGSDNIYGNKDDLYNISWGGETLNDSMAAIYSFEIDTTNMDGLSNGTKFTKDQRSVYNLDENGKLKEFTTRYPGIFRMGFSHQSENYLFSSDIWTGFENRFFARAHWKWAMGMEVYKFPSMPLRLGYAWGGSDFKELAMGIGVHKGPIIFDVGFAFRNGIWIHTMKGFNLSLGLTITGLGSRKEEVEESSGDPAPPVPESETRFKF